MNFKLAAPLFLLPLFLLGGLAYALLYLVGVKSLRSLAYFGSLIVMGMIVVQVLQDLECWQP